MEFNFSVVLTYTKNMYNAMASLYPLIVYNSMIPSLLKELLDTQETAVNQLTDSYIYFTTTLLY